MYGIPPRFSDTESISFLDDLYNENPRICETLAAQSAKAGKDCQIFRNIGNEVQKKTVVFDVGDEVWKAEEKYFRSSEMRTFETWNEMICTMCSDGGMES